MAPSGAASETGRDIVSFDNPPLSEVACGVGFANRAGLTPIEIGRFWTKIVNEYPRSEVAPPLPYPGVPFMIITIPSPRMIFRTENGSQVLQIQPNWFLFNWVRAKSGSEYPRYHNVLHAFERELARFQEHLEVVGIGAIDVFQQFTLSYVNHIPRRDGWKTRDELRLFMPDFFATWPTHHQLREPSDLFMQFGQELGFGHLNVSVRNGRTQADPEEIFVLELAVSSPLAPKEPSSMKSWFDQARESIVMCFVDLISSEARKKWGLHE
jgi:uncharacterized protein (TIGR04255 family)